MIGLSTAEIHSNQRTQNIAFSLTFLPETVNVILSLLFPQELNDKPRERASASD